MNKPKSAMMQGPADAPIAFVGAVSSDIDIARREPVTGPAGCVFKSLYLKPLRLSKEEVLVANIDGEPSPVRDFIEDLPVRPYVIALSQQAKSELGPDFVDFVLPHPDAVRRLGDSGEVARKIRRVKRILMKQEALGAEGGETKEESAERFWNNNWHNVQPDRKRPEIHRRG